jgi:hypothetical protein
MWSQAPPTKLTQVFEEVTEIFLSEVIFVPRMFAVDASE